VLNVKRLVPSQLGRALLLDFPFLDLKHFDTLSTSIVGTQGLKRLQVSAFLFAVGTGAVRSAWSDPEPIRIEYHADPSCPSEQQFRQDVTVRAAKSAPQYGLDPRLFVVTMTGSNDRSYGRLQIYGTSGSVFAREVAGENCSEVASALALVTALAIDPQAFTIPGASSSAVELLPSTAPPPDKVPPVASSMQPVGPKSALPAQYSVPAPMKISTEPRRVMPGSPVTWVWATGIQGISMSHIVPKPALGAGLSTDVAPSGSWIIWPDFRLAATYVTTVNWWDGSAGFGARWWWLLARAEACPARFSMAEASLVLRACGGFEGGVVTVRARSLTNATDVTKVNGVTTQEWAALGPALRLTWQANARLNVEIGSGLSFPLTRWNFTYRDNLSDEDPQVANIGSWGWTLGGNISYKWR